MKDSYVFIFTTINQKRKNLIEEIIFFHEDAETSYDLEYSK